MGVVLIKWAWLKNFAVRFARVCIYNPTILKILDPPLSTVVPRVFFLAPFSLQYSSKFTLITN